MTQHFEPDATYRAGLALGLVTFVALLAMLVAPARRNAPSPPPVPEATRWAAVTVLGCAALVLLASGWVGLVVGLAGWAVAALARRLRPAWEGWALGLCLTPAVLAYVFGPWQESWAGRSAWPHYVVVFTLGAVSCWAATSRLPRRASDMPGRSTSQ